MALPNTERTTADAGDGLGSAEPRTLLAILRTRLFELSVLLWSLPFGLVIMTYLQVYRPPKQVRWLLRLWSSGFVVLARWIMGVRYRIEGLERIPTGPVIYAPNHQSYWESIAFTAFVPDINVITKRSAMAYPVFGWGLKHAPMTPVDREVKGSNLRRLLREAKVSVAEGRSILIYPEGTRVAPGGRLEFQRGVQLLYRHCGVPIVPVVHNAGRLWPPGFAAKTPGEITVRVLPPIAPGQDDAAVMRDLEARLNLEKDRLLLLDPD